MSEFHWKKRKKSSALFDGVIRFCFGFHQQILGGNIVKCLKMIKCEISPIRMRIGRTYALRTFFVPNEAQIHLVKY